MTMIEAAEGVVDAPSSSRLAVHPLAGFVGRRLLSALVTLWLLSVLVFFTTAVLPGDAASAILGRQASGEGLANLREQLGLDRPLIEQYWSWFTGVLHGDLGVSASSVLNGSQQTVWDDIAPKLSNSLALAAAAFVPIVVVSVGLGIYAALRANRWQDHVISAATVIPAAVPEFVLGALLTFVFFTWLGWLPPVSLVPPGQNALSDPRLLVLPVLVLVGVTIGPAARMVRAGMMQALGSQSVRAARLNGIDERTVLRRYALRNAIAPSIIVFGLIAQYLVGGLLVVEYLFAYPGIGRELVAALSINDNVAVSSITMVLATIFIGISIVADVLVVIAVPRLRTGGA